MDQDNPLPLDQKSRLTQRDVVTEKAEADQTLVEIDQVVRDAVQNTSKCELDARADELIAKLANLKTIRELAAIGEPLPKLGAYELLDQLGRGGMGTVYRAKHRQLGKIQALKVIHSQSGLTPEIRTRFRREVQAIGALKHPNIIAAHDADFEGDVPYLVMDYVEGESLAEVQKRLKSDGLTISVGAACELVRQAAWGLQYAHDQQITHRDIKPGNLMLDGEGVVRVLDLGLARLGAQEGGAEHEATEITRGGEILGTPDYMSPEQLQSSRIVDARTDVYALGMTLFSLLFGSPVYRSKPGESFIAKATRLLHEPIPNLRKLLPDVPKPLADIIAKCLAKSPDERLQSAGELAEAISPWASPEAVKALLPNYVAPQEPAKHAVSPGGTKAERSKLPPRVLIGVAAAFLFTLLIAAGVLLTIRLPGGGELIVDSDDPQAKIQVVAVKDGQREDLSLTHDGGNTLRLGEGRWTILIEGADAAEFTLSEDEIVINEGTKAEIRVTRRDTALANRAAPATGPVGGTTITDAGLSSAPSAPSGSERRTDEPVVDWSQVRSDGYLAGLVPAPKKHSELWQWQIRPWLPPLTQHAHGLTENRIAIDPAGKHYAVISQYDCKIMEFSRGAVTHTIPSPRGSHWAGVAMTAGCQRVALLSKNNGFVEIRDARNRMVAQWNASELIDGSSSHGAITWRNSGEQLVVWGAHQASVVDIHGNVQASIEFEPGAGPEHDPAITRMPVQHAVACAPDGGRIAFGCADGNVRIWDMQTNALRVLPFEQVSDRANESIRAVHWSPDGGFLGALRAHQWSNGVALEIWSRDGLLKSTIGAEQLQVAEQAASEFAWSPDGRLLVLGGGKVVDQYGNSQREFNLLGEERAYGSRRITSVWVPSWSTNQRGGERIDFVASGDTHGLQCGRVQSFTPTGRTLTSSRFRNILQPQELSWIEETGKLAVVFGYPDSSELRTWSIDGEPQSTVAIPSFVTGKIQSRSGKLLCLSGRQFTLLDPSGSEMGLHAFDANFELGQWEWNHAGDWTAYSGKVDGKGVVRLLNNSGDRLINLQLPDEIADRGLSTSSGYLFWSPDDKYLAMNLLMADATQRVFVWETASDSSLPMATLEMTDGQTPHLVWSPDSQWLAVAPRTVEPKSGTILRFLHVASRQVKQNVTEHNYFPARFSPEWFDERSIRIGGLVLNMPVEPDSQIRVRDLGFTLQNAQAAVNMKNFGEVLVLRSADRGPSFEVWKDGTLESSSPAPPIASSDFRKNTDGTRAVFFTGNPYDAFVQVDLSTGTVDYISMACDNGSTIELAADGSLLNPNSDVDNYLGYTLRYPGGAEVSVSQADFEKRQQADAAKAALQWILDIGGLVQTEGNDTWLSNRDAAENLAALSPSQIGSIDLTGCVLTNESLAQLVHFENLQSLDLSRTRLASLEFLPKLEKLASLTLQQLQLKTLSTLQHVESLRRLDLSNSPFDSSIATTLVSARQLQSLNLANTNVDRFLLDDLTELPQLKRIDIRQTKILAEEIESFTKRHPAISVD